MAASRNPGSLQKEFGAPSKGFNQRIQVSPGSSLLEEGISWGLDRESWGSFKESYRIPSRGS